MDLPHAVEMPEPPRRPSLWQHAKSAASLTVITLNLVFWALPLFVLGITKLVVPGRRGIVEGAMAWIYRAAVAVDDWWLRRVMGIRWNQPTLDLVRDESYLVLCNHASWSDIFLIQSVIVAQGPAVKFLSKRELIFVPILGLVFWAFDFPILRRRSSRGGSEEARRADDLEAIREACRAVIRQPAALMNFVEGTRFAETKRVATASPYKYLLRPRVGGFLAIADTLGGHVAGLVDLTLIYSRPVSFWAFLSGASPKVEIIGSMIDPADLPATREAAEAWLARRWEEKERAIGRARTARGEA